MAFLTFVEVKVWVSFVVPNVTRRNLEIKDPIGLKSDYQGDWFITRTEWTVYLENNIILPFQ